MRLTHLPLLLTLMAFAFPAKADGPQVVELFSSVVCKYCPAAEAAFDDFSQTHQDIIALNCFVKVVDLRGDTISRPACNARQRHYASTLPNGSIGTPMYTINGRDMIPHVRTEYAAFMQASLRANGKIEDIHILPALSANTDTQIQLPRLPRPNKDESYAVWLVTTRTPFTAKILGQPPRQFTHVVRDMTKLIDWDGNRRTLSLKVTPATDTSKLIILVETPSKQIVAAGQVAWKK